MSAAAAAATRQTVRRWVMTGAVSAIVIAGTWAGASLKIDVEKRKEKKELLQLGPEDIIARLEQSKLELQRSAHQIERKIEASKAERLGLEVEKKGR